jgi:hypothetical protein
LVYVWSGRDSDAPAPLTVTPVYAADFSTSDCPFGQLKLPGLGGPTDKVPVVWPFLTGNRPLALTGPLTVSLLVAEGWLPPPFTHS